MRWIVGIISDAIAVFGGVKLLAARAEWLQMRAGTPVITTMRALEEKAITFAQSRDNRGKAHTVLETSVDVEQRRSTVWLFPIHLLAGNRDNPDWRAPRSR